MVEKSNNKEKNFSSIGFIAMDNDSSKFIVQEVRLCSKVAYFSVCCLGVMVVCLVLAPILINHFHDDYCREIIYEDPVNCNFTLLETIPENLTYFQNQTTFSSIFDSWVSMVTRAQTSIKIVSFYWTLTNNDPNGSTSWMGENLLQELRRALKRKVNLRIITNSPDISNDTALLEKEGAEVLRFNMSKFEGRGVVHTKMWLVDEREVFVGSANMDWRSLSQVKEIGLEINNCQSVALEIKKIINTFNYIINNDGIPKSWPCYLKTNYKIEHPLEIEVNGIPSSVIIAVSPPSFCIPQRPSELETLIHFIKSANNFIYISVMDYSPSSLFNRPNKFWPVIDSALKDAAITRGVKIRILASLWKNTKHSMLIFLKSLAILDRVWYGVSIQVKLFCVPSFSKFQEEIPFARVNHDKYMVTDQTAYITTSNWSEDYFEATHGVGLSVNSSSLSNSSINFQLKNHFMRDWSSKFTVNVLDVLNITRPFSCQDYV